MSQKQIDAILWRKYLSATSHAIWEVSASQYYFELPDRGYEDFFDGHCQNFIDKDGNNAFKMTLEKFDGAPAVDSHEVTFAQKRPGAHREGKWTVDSIRDGSARAYDLWRKVRGPVDEFNNLSVTEKEKNYILIARDIEGGFHGRWLRGSDFDAMPSEIQKILTSENAGWRKL